MGETAISSEVDANGFTIVHVFEASREEVWAEWTTPESFADWFGGTASEVPVSTVTMDVRPGGAWAATMYAGPARHEIQWVSTSSCSSRLCSSSPSPTSPARTHGRRSPSS